MPRCLNNWVAVARAIPHGSGVQGRCGVTWDSSRAYLVGEPIVMMEEEIGAVTKVQTYCAHTG